MFYPFGHFCCTPLDVLQQIRVSPALRMPHQIAVLQVRPHQRAGPPPCPAGRTAPDAAHDTVCSLGCKISLLALLDLMTLSWALPDPHLRDPPDHDVSDLAVVPGGGTEHSITRPFPQPPTGSPALSSPGLQRRDAHQLVHSLHSAGHRGDELLLVHVGAVAPADRTDV